MATDGNICRQRGRVRLRERREIWVDMKNWSKEQQKKEQRWSNDSEVKKEAREYNHLWCTVRWGSRPTTSGFAASLCGGGLCRGARQQDCSLLAGEIHGLNSRDFLDRNLVFLDMHLRLYRSGDEWYFIAGCAVTPRMYGFFSRAYALVCAHSMLLPHGQHSLLNPTCHVAYVANTCSA